MRNIRFLSTLAIASLLFLTACTGADDVTNNEIPSQEEEVIDTEIGEEETEINTEGLNDYQMELLSTLSDIRKNVEVGTAGSSLKAVSPTSGLMNWAIGTALSADQIEEVVSLYLNSLTDDEKAEFISQLELLNSTYKVLLSEDRDSLLETSGNTDMSKHAWIDVLGEVTTLENFDSLMKSAGVTE